MKRLTIIVPDNNANLISIIGTYMVFLRADQYWQSSGRRPTFKTELAGISKNVELYNGLFAVKPKLDISEIAKTDFVIIPAVQPDCNFSESIKENKVFASWIRQQYRNGAEVASICTGAFLLASTGILDGRSCSTHWLLADTFHRMFPKVNLVTHKIITDENGIYTSGGGMSFMNFLLYLVEKYYDRQTAIFISKTFEIDMDRQSQSPFMVFYGQKDHGDEAIREAQDLIENNFREGLSIAHVARNVAIGRRQFDRRFKRATGNTPVEYIRRVKIEAAKQGLEMTRKTIKEVMYETGYSDFKAFRATFRKITGLSPLEYRKKYNKETISS